MQVSGSVPIELSRQNSQNYVLVYQKRYILNGFKHFFVNDYRVAVVSRLPLTISGTITETCIDLTYDGRIILPLIFSYNE